MKKILSFFLIISTCYGFSQNKIDSILTLSEYIGYVKKFHPIVKQAELKTSEGEIKLMKARGAFDPKLEVDYDKKKFKNTNYFDKLNTTFKINIQIHSRYNGLTCTKNYIILNMNNKYKI